MKNTSRKPYIYKVTNLETHQYYIGSQCSGKTIGVNYFTSSTNKEFKNGFKTYGEEKYEITIVKAFGDPKECVNAENLMIRDHMQLKDGLCLNRSYHCNGENVFSMVGTHHSEETKQKMRVVKKGFHNSEDARKKMSAAHKGQTHSEETKQKMSIAKKGISRSEETKQKISRAQKGTAHKGQSPSEETRKKMSRARKGFHNSEETRKKISIAHKRKISIKNTVFDSLTEAAKYYNVNRATISYWLKTKKHNAVCVEKCPKI